MTLATVQINKNLITTQCVPLAISEQSQYIIVQTWDSRTIWNALTWTWEDPSRWKANRKEITIANNNDQHLLSARAKPLAWVISVECRNSSTWEVLLLYLFYEWRNPGLEKWINISCLYLSDLRTETFNCKDTQKCSKISLNWNTKVGHYLISIGGNPNTDNVLKSILLFHMVRNKLSKLNITTCNRSALHNNLLKT